MLQKHDGDPHKIGVVVTANAHDFSSLHVMQSEEEVRTYPKPLPCWIQIELINGDVTPTVFRIGRKSRNQRYVLKASNSAESDLAKWDSIEPKTDGIHEDGRLVTVKCSGDQPYRFFRFVLDEPRNAPLCLKHVELFGFLADGSG
jgi:hypothetical protein